MNTIAFNRNKDPYGWLSNMYPCEIDFGGKKWRTTEALFQALRFKDEAIQELIRAEKSPMSAKDVMTMNQKHLSIQKYSDTDIMNMRMCLKLKLAQHPNLVNDLLETEDALIVEDITKRGDKGGNMVWGAMLVGEEWIGQNILGNLWMELRKEHKILASKGN